MSKEKNNNYFNNVSETAFWVARFRAKESKRPDALFNDPLASLLVKDKDSQSLENRSDAQYVNWTVVMRTIIIDEMIEDLILSGVNTIINLGAGLDTRPYRMNLPDSLEWIEADLPEIISYKERVLLNEKSMCKLTRFSLDLADERVRNQFLKEQGMKSSNILVITEGVLPYLEEEEVSSLAQQLSMLPGYTKWIGEYHSNEMYKHLRNKKKNREMGKATFKFFPVDWLKFFEKRNWKAEKISYLMEKGESVSRPFPMAWWAKILHSILPSKEIEKFRKMSGFILFERK
jgi:methyltransferase (TIGR00027 family)